LNVTVLLTSNVTGKVTRFLYICNALLTGLDTEKIPWPLQRSSLVFLVFVQKSVFKKAMAECFL